MNVGDTILFGGYEWLVLEIQNDNAMILTKDLILNRKYHEQMVNVTWDTCDLRQYLNGEFYDKFSQEEKEKIITTTVKTLDNKWSEEYGRVGKGGIDTEDKVFLLSIEELIRFFGDNGDFENKVGWTWKGTTRKVIFNGGNGVIINNEYNEKRKATYNDKPLFWWLRSPGTHNQSVVTVIEDGSVVMHGHCVSGNPHGVRPAMWISLK